MEELLPWLDTHVLGQSGADRSLEQAVREFRSRVAYLCEVGLGYMAANRLTRSLSGGEIERVSLTACLGAALTETLFVLDEPTVGLHARDTARLISAMRRLAQRGNTLVVVEHEEAVMRAADYLVDMGPGSGAAGGIVSGRGVRCPAHGAAGGTFCCSAGGQCAGSDRPDERDCRSVAQRRRDF
jgi:excinuclease ABC subunit A